MIRKAKRSSAANHDGSGLPGSVFGRRSFATRGASARSQGSGAPTHSRLRATLAALTVIAALAFTAAPASATKMGTISEVSYGSAKLTGTATTAGFINTWSFEYCSQECSEPTATWNPGPGGTIIGSTGDKPVEAKIEDLKSATKYFIRLTATPSGGSATFSPAAPPYPEFTTLTADPTAVLSVDNASDVAYTTAKVTGEIVRPAKSNDVACHFEYITDAHFTANLGNSAPGFEGATEVPCDTGNPAETPGTIQTTGNVPVSAKLGNLSPATAYHLRLAVSNAAGADAKEAVQTFTTLTVDPPSVLATDNASEVEYTQAQVKGVVERPDTSPDPALDVNCNFEYVTDQQFNDNPSGEEFASATAVPCNPSPVTAADTAPGATKEVKATLGGLVPQTTYHLRLSASNLGGSDAKEAAATFITAGPIPKPVVLSTDDATDVTIHEATVTGEVQRPAGKDPGLDINCRFEYVTQPQFEAEEFAAAEPNGQIAGCVENPIIEATVDGEGKQAVSAQLGGLIAGTIYHVRLVAENNGGTAIRVATDTFTTLEVEKPVVTIDPVAGGTYTTAHVSGTVNSTIDSAQIAFYVSSDSGATWSGVGGSSVNKGTTQVTHDFAGLSPSTTYTFRIGATYSGFGILGGAEPLNEVAFSSEPNPSITTEPLFPPTAEDLAVTDITGTSAHLSGKVDPHAPAGPLNEAAKKAFATHWEFVCTPECKDANGNVIGGTIQGEEGAQTVSGDVKRLEPDTPYEVSLIISSEGGGETVVETFKTLKSPPSVKQAPGASDGEGGYTLQGVVNPNNETITDCKFEWGPDSAKYAFSADCSPLSISGSKPITVEAHLTGLNPDVDYHALLVVTYGAGSEAKGVDQTFKATLNQPEPCPANEQLRKENSSLALPECRAYEMVTPPGKEGFDAVLWGYDQDDRVLFYSNAGNIARSGQGYSNNRYVAARSAAGWETIPDLNGSSGSIYDAPSNIHIPNGPPAVPIKYSADLLSSIWFTNKIDSLMQNYYLRGQDGTFNLIGKGGLSGDRGGYSFQIGGASDDLSHLLITSNDIVGDGVSPPWGPGVYEFLGTGNEQDPRRVDLDNSGSPISTCSGLPRSNGIQAGAARAAFISRDGRVVLVRVAGGCGGANPPAVGIWARIGGTVSVDVSASRCNRTAADPGGSCNAPAEATFESATPDGSRIFFTTKQQLVNGDTDETNDIYACDIPPGTSAPVGNANPCSALMQVSAGDSGGAAVENVATTSDDGSTALFAAKGVLAGNEDALGEAPVAGDHNLYAWHQDSGHPAGQTTFLGRLGSNDIGAQSTPDGRYVVFTTAARLLSTDTDDARDVYRYDVVTGELTRVSTNVFGVGGNGPGFGAAISARPSFSPVNPSSTTSHPTASDDGQSIIFTTAEALSPADGNGEPDVYLWTPDRVSLISTGSVGGGVNGGDLPGNLAFITASGRDIYFQTRGALTPADGDSLVDVYDARLDGGFSFAPAATCSGEACQATPTSSSSTAPSPANRLGGEGNPKPKVCPKGKVVKGDKCMKKQPKKNKGKHHKHHKHHKGKHHKGNGKGRQPASSDHWGGK